MFPECRITIINKDWVQIADTSCRRSTHYHCILALSDKTAFTEQVSAYTRKRKARSLLVLFRQRSRSGIKYSFLNCISTTLVVISLINQSNTYVFFSVLGFTTKFVVLRLQNTHWYVISKQTFPPVDTLGHIFFPLGCHHLVFCTAYKI